MSGIIGTLGAAWAAYSFWATVSGAIGVGLIVLALVATTILPGFIRKPLICAGAAILALSVAYQAGSTHGAHEASLRAQRLSQAAEATRVVVASRVTKGDVTRLNRDLASERVQNLELRKILDALRKDRQADRVCVDRGISRRLRNL